MNWADWWDRKEQNNFALIDAIKKENLPLIKELLNEQLNLDGVCADLNHRNDNDETPLHEAVKVCNETIVKLLLAKFVEINAENSRD